MLRTFRNVSVVFAVLLLGACTRDLSYTEMQALLPAQPADKGRIYFYREVAYLGNLITPDVVLNNKPVGTSNPGAFFYVDREPGDYTVFCGKGEYNVATFTLAAGQEVYVRTKIGDSILTTTMVTEVTTAPVAIPAIHNLKFVPR
ncbi:MAG: hypothetical protein JWR07_5407 [Nevskia sp.]|nr:hypothetical protein [Nevskia sp.]